MSEKVTCSTMLNIKTLVFLNVVINQNCPSTKKIRAAMLVQMTILYNTNDL